MYLILTLIEWIEKVNAESGNEWSIFFFFA